MNKTQFASFIVLSSLIFLPGMSFAQVQIPLPSSGTVNQVVNTTQGMVTGITSNSGLTSTNNPLHVNSTQLTQVTNTWFDTLKQLITFAESFHNSTATSASTLSGGQIPYQWIWAIGIILTLIAIAVIVYKLMKWWIKIVFIVIIILVALMEYHILTT